MVMVCINIRTSKCSSHLFNKLEENMSLLQTIRKALKSKSKSSVSLKYKDDDDDERQLFAAINEGNFRMARSLVEGKVSVNCKDSSGCADSRV